MEAILACHPDLSTKWLGWVDISRELWHVHTGVAYVTMVLPLVHHGVTLGLTDNDAVRRNALVNLTKSSCYTEEELISQIVWKNFFQFLSVWCWIVFHCQVKITESTHHCPTVTILVVLGWRLIEGKKGAGGGQREERERVKKEDLVMEKGGGGVILINKGFDSRDNGACVHYVMVSKFQWKPFWLATQWDPTEWLDCHPKSCELWRIHTGPIT